MFTFSEKSNILFITLNLIINILTFKYYISKSERRPGCQENYHADHWRMYCIYRSF